MTQVPVPPGAPLRATPRPRGEAASLGARNLAAGAAPPVGLLLATLLAACGGAEDGDAPASARETAGHEAAAGSEPTVPSPPVAWESMSHQEQADWMSEEVVPRMAARFQRFDAERYATVSCGTCHGPGAAAGDFEMPSNALPALPPTGSPEQQAMVRQHPEMVRFMYNDVLPTMQTLVGGADYDEETGEGFSCYACHPHQGDEGSTLILLDGPVAK